MTNIHNHKILILDFGSQYTQLIARRVREIGVYCELWAWDVTEQEIREFNPTGIILSGGPEIPCWCASIRYLLRHADDGNATWWLNRNL